MSKVIGVTVGTTYDKNKLGGGGGGLTEDQVALLQDLSKWYDDEHKIAITSFTIYPVTTTYKMGSSARITFLWEFNKTPTSVTFDGESQTPAQNGSVTVEDVSESSHTTRTFKLCAEFNEEKVEGEIAIKFRNLHYYGAAAEPDTINEAFLSELSSGWAENRIKSAFTPNCTKGTYVWYLYPARLGEAQMWMGGFQNGFEAPFTVDDINGEPYYVYRSTNSGIGSLTIEAK